MKMSEQSIGVFDSGIGGLSVLRHIRQTLPNEHLCYVADSLHAPYGNKTPAFIIERASKIAEFLIAQQAKALVLACNTATAAAVATLRAKYSLPIIGMEPAVKPAAAATKTGVVGVLATVGTLKSAQFAALLESYGQNIQVVTQACNGLVECVERGDMNTPNTKALIKRYVTPLIEAKADTIVLGCTHYPFLRALIQAEAGKQATIIDTGAAVAKQLQHRMQTHDLLCYSKEKGQETFWSNSASPKAPQLMQTLWGKPVNVQTLMV